MKDSRDKMLTNEEYLTHEGTICPVCGGDEIEGGPVQIESCAAWQEMGCINCGSSWHDVYDLIEYQLQYDGISKTKFVNGKPTE